MKEPALNMEYVSPSQQIPFHCTGCGACCRHVRQSVPLESMDVFRLSKYLRGQGDGISNTDDFLLKYAESALLNECGYFVFFLKVQEDDSCIFLKENRCTVQTVKPRACRMYPFAAEPLESGKFRYLVSREHSFHFKGPKVSVKRWMNQYFYPEEREALYLDFCNVLETVHLLRRIPEDQKARALTLFGWYLYSAYDLDGSFLEQYQHNLARLQSELRGLAREKQ